MPYACIINGNSTGQKTLAVTAASAGGKSNSLLDSVTLCGTSAIVASAGHVQLRVSTNSDLTGATQFQLVTPTCSAIVSGSCRAQYIFNPPIQIQSGGGGFGISADSIPNSNFTTMSVLVGYHWS